MKTDPIISNEYKELEEKYNTLLLKYNKLNSRFYSVMKMSDRTFQTFFKKNIKADKFNKRFNIILKQSDKQSKYFLIENERQEQLILEQSKMASMGEMLENIIHQMKQPLSLITTASTALELKKEMDMLSDEEFLQFTSKITNSTAYLSETINSFRDFFNKDKQKQNFSLTMALVKAKNLLESKFKNKDIKVIHELNDIMIFGVENELIQIFTNLFSNSIDALENNTDEKLIFISSFIKNNQIIIQFSDSGGGVPENIIKKIFNSHFTTKADDKGTGVGLYMTKMIIENSFNGTINIENKKHYYQNRSYFGACFTIIIVPYSN